MAVYLWERTTKRRTTFLHPVDAKEALASGRYLPEEPREPERVEEKPKIEPEKVEVEVAEEKEEKSNKDESKDEEKPKTPGPQRMGPKKTR